MPGTWYGGSDTPTSTKFFGMPTGAKLSDYHEEAWAAGCKLIAKLLDERDGNGCAVVQLIYTRDDDDVKVIAYRFTSDWAYYKFNSELVDATCLLGRGVFKPFNDDWTFWNFCA